jgi:cysteine desulfurase / selenocysteine lyase
LNPAELYLDFPLLRDNDDEERLIFLDNAATTQKPDTVINAVSAYYRESNANVHRSPYRLGEKSTDLYESARSKTARFIKAADDKEIVFTRGVTESINLLATILSDQLLKPGDVILLTEAEHHSNIVPWQIIAKRCGVKLEFVKLHGDGRFDLSEIESNWNPKTKVFSFQHASNVLGTIHPVNELCEIARCKGAVSIVDGAQSVPHFGIDVSDMGCDFYTFSGHKMVGPTGIGALYGRRELLERFDPAFGGGEMIKRVSLFESEYNDVPHKFEAGTPNIAGAIGLGAAIDYLEKLTMKKVESMVNSLAAYALERLSTIEGLAVHGPQTDRTGAISFWMDGIHPHDIASLLDGDNIAVRAGRHCAEPIMNWLKRPATTRASFYIYNIREDVDRFIDSLNRIRGLFKNVS